MKRRIQRIDAFAEGRFKGNPAGVFILQTDLPDSTLQKITFLSGLPVVSFLKALPNNEYNIRWFTPSCEVNLCGHGTMAATYWLYLTLNSKEISFQSKSGPLTAKITEVGKIEMDFPAQLTTPCDVSTKNALEAVLGIKVKACQFGHEDYLVELESGQVVANFTPNFSKIKKINCRGIIITGWDNQYGYDCVSRFFCPRVAINEDQVCVSAHCKILPYWQAKKGKNQLHAWQASSNGGELYLYALTNNRIRIQGNAKKGEVVVV